ncbi:hypothetical protein E2P81_ATG00703 [Venturia nashicola]|uniref:Uncharacterized protein n=1 Tax=Venturia nashicola TaxID=86259 RepID=A0A4Z1PJ26_9PEZI|nr:hypothetical protein E6O75_ATG00714 [Venturia nashicola]TLD39716.1 hypothetical protein E2P81_ATG00703 [Venturia nashicola]
MADQRAQAELASSSTSDHDRILDTAALDGMEALSVKECEGLSMEGQSLGAFLPTSTPASTIPTIEASATPSLSPSQRNNPSLQGMPSEIRENIFAHVIVDLFHEKWGPSDEFDECARTCLLNIFKVDPRFEAEALPSLIPACTLVVDESRNDIPRFQKVINWVTDFNLGRYVQAVKYRHVPPATYPFDNAPESPHIMDLLALCPNVNRITITTTIYDVFVFPSAKGIRNGEMFDFLDTMKFHDLMDLPQLKEINLHVEAGTSYKIGLDPGFDSTNVWPFWKDSKTMLYLGRQLCEEEGGWEVRPVSETMIFLMDHLCAAKEDSEVRVSLWSDFGFDDEMFVGPAPRDLWTVEKGECEKYVQLLW